MKQTIKRISISLLALTMLVSLAACDGAPTQDAQPTGGMSGTTTEPAAPTGSAAADNTSEPAEDKIGGIKMLVAVFSLPGEQYEVGVIEEGKTVQEQRGEAREAVTEWLREGGFVE